MSVITMYVKVVEVEVDDVEKKLRNIIGTHVAICQSGTCLWPRQSFLRLKHTQYIMIAKSFGTISLQALFFQSRS